MSYFRSLAGKSADTEENIDIYFTRPLGWLWAKFFQKLDTHPNVVTILSMCLGLLAALCMWQGKGSWCYTLGGIFLLVWANIYDSADGQLARLTGKKTQWGRILDGFAGNLWFIAIYAALAYRLMQAWVGYEAENSLGHVLKIWGFFACVGLGFHAPQSRLADYYRNVHLYFITGGRASELHQTAQLREAYALCSWRKQWCWKLFLKNYIAYTAAQERATPCFQQLKAALEKKYGADQALPTALTQLFREGSLPLMKWANFLTFNWRAFSLYLSLLLAVRNEMWLFLYPVLEITVFYYVYLYMNFKHERLSVKALEWIRLKEGKL